MANILYLVHRFPIRPTRATRSVPTICSSIWPPPTRCTSAPSSTIPPTRPHVETVRALRADLYVARFRRARLSLKRRRLIHRTRR